MLAGTGSLLRGADRVRLGRLRFGLRDVHLDARLNTRRSTSAVSAASIPGSGRARRHGPDRRASHPGQRPTPKRTGGNVGADRFPGRLTGSSPRRSRSSRARRRSPPVKLGSRLMAIASRALRRSARFIALPRPRAIRCQRPPGGDVVHDSLLALGVKPSAVDQRSRRAERRRRKSTKPRTPSPWRPSTRPSASAASLRSISSTSFPTSSQASRSDGDTRESKQQLLCDSYASGDSSLAARQNTPCVRLLVPGVGGDQRLRVSGVLGHQRTV